MAFEIDLDTGWAGRKYLSMDEESVIFDDTQMMCNEIVSFSYGTTLTLVSGIKANNENQFCFIDSSGDKIAVKFYNSALFDTNPKDAFEKIAHEVWKCFGNRLKEEVIQKLARGLTVELCGIALHSTGITITHKPVFGSRTDYLIPWEELEYNLEEGIINLRSASERKARINLFISAIDGQLLWSLLNSISEEAGVLERIKRIK